MSCPLIGVVLLMLACLLCLRKLMLIKDALINNTKQPIDSVARLLNAKATPTAIVMACRAVGILHAAAYNAYWPTIINS